MFIALALGGLINASPASANANKSVICGWHTTDTKTGIKYAFYYKNDLTVKSKILLLTDDEYHRYVCDEPVNGKTDEMWRAAASSPVSNVGAWKKQRFETTWADRCNDSDPVAVFFGTMRSSCVDYKKDEENWAKPKQSTPHDLLSCMRSGHSYFIKYDGKTIYMNETNGGSVTIRDEQLNCTKPSRHLEH